MRGNTIVRLGINNVKTSASKAFIKAGNDSDEHVCVTKLHAETNAMIWARPGDTLYIYRWNKSGTPKASRPCQFCMRTIKRLGIRRIYYLSNEGEVIRENIRC